jgi:hypothetical protein
VSQRSSQIDVTPRGKTVIEYSANRTIFSKQIPRTLCSTSPRRAVLYSESPQMDFSKMEARKLDLETIEFALRDTLDEVLRTLAHEAFKKGLELVCEVRPERSGRSRRSHRLSLFCLRESRRSFPLSLLCDCSFGLKTPRVTDQLVSDSAARRRWITARFLRDPPLQIRPYPLYRVFTEACPSWNGTRIFC